MENKKKQLLDAMKALPMTMEDKCAFVDLISQNSNSGGTSQEDEYFYFDVRDVDSNVIEDIAMMCPYVIVEMDNKILELTAYFSALTYDDLSKTFIAVKAKTYVTIINDDDLSYPSLDLKYYKIDVIKIMNAIGAKQITKEEYNSFITFTIDDFEETTVG